MGAGNSAPKPLATSFGEEAPAGSPGVTKGPVKGIYGGYSGYTGMYKVYGFRGSTCKD